MSDILITPNDTFNPNQTRLIAISPSLYEAANTYLSIYKKENIQDLVRLNILYILTDIYDKN